MRVLVIGSGAIGTFTGGVLMKDGCDVTFLDLPPVVKKLKEGGIIVDGLGESIRIPEIKAVDSIDDKEPFDLAIIAVKSNHTRAAVKNLREDAASRILTFQNGIGNEEVLAEKFGRNRIIAGSLTYPVAFPRLGHVIIENPKAGMGFSSIDPKIGPWNEVRLFKEAGLNVFAESDYRALKWSKLFLNLICNATCAILDMSPGEIFSDRRLVKIERDQILEALRVMKKLRIKLINFPGYSVKMAARLYSISPPSVLKLALRKKIEKGRGNKKPSLLLALDRGINYSEVIYMNGAVAKQGEESDVDTPVNRILCDTLVDIASGKIPRDKFRKNTEEFLALFKNR